MVPTPEDDDMAHRQVSWMVPADMVFLEFLAAARTAHGEPSVQTPTTIAINTGYSNRHASARCIELVDRGLVERVDEGKYRLTELGERAAAGTMGFDELEKL